MLRTIAEQTGQSMQDVLDRAVEEHRRRVFFDSLNSYYAELRQDPKAWAEELEERAAWDVTLADGLEGD